jgi:hypothetical protein
MTPLLHHYLKQWTLYKRALIAFLALNVFSLVLAIVLGFNFFFIDGDRVAADQAALRKVFAADEALSQLSAFSAGYDKLKPLTIRTAQDEQKVLERLENWHNLLKKVEDLELGLAPSSTFLGSPLVYSAESFNKLQTLSTKLTELKATELKAIQGRLESYSRHSRLMVVTGLATLLFGILLPHFILYLLARGLNKVRVELQNSAYEFIAKWNETRSSFGEEAFKNAEFWLQILLLIGEQSSRLSRHPAFQFSGELAHLIRAELAKKNSHTRAS